MLKKLSVLVLGSACTIGLAGCDVDVEDEGRLPEVEMTEGEMPEVDVRGPEVDAHMEEKTVEVPDIDVDIPEEDDNE